MLAVGKPEGGNLLTKARLLEIMKLWEAVDGHTTTYNGKTYNLEARCDRPEPSAPCRVQSVLAAWNYDKAALAADANVLQTIRDAGRTLFSRTAAKNSDAHAQTWLAALSCKQAVTFWGVGGWG